MDNQGNLPLLYHNRELSWLKFNQRVLEQARDNAIPLLERLKFISIFGSNLDEFYMIRVGTLTDAALLEPDETDNKLGMSPAEQLQAIFAQTRSLAAQKDEVYQLLMRDLTQEHGIEQLDPETLDGEKAEYLERYFTH